jgi:hypothetical protein
LDEPSDGFSHRRLIRLLQTPPINALYKIVRDAHLEQTILDPPRRPPHKCIDLYYKYHYKYSEPIDCLQQPIGPNLATE